MIGAPLLVTRARRHHRRSGRELVELRCIACGAVVEVVDARALTFAGIPHAPGCPVAKALWRGCRPRLIANPNRLVAGGEL